MRWCLLPAALALLPAAACGGGGGPQGARVFFVELRPLAPPAREALPRVVHAFEVPAELDPWQVEGGEHALGVEGETRRLLLWGETRKLVRLPGSFDPESFQRVVVRVGSDDEVVISAHLLREGAGQRNTERIRIGTTRPEREVELTFPRLAARGEHFDGLALHFEGQGRHSILGSVELIDLPPASLLPDPAGEPGLILVEKDARRGVGLHAGGTLAGTVELFKGAQLSFSYALRHDRDTLSPAGARLWVRVHAGGRAAVERAFPLEQEAEERWRSARIALGPRSGRTARISFELEAPGDPRAAVALADVRVERRARDAPSVLLVTSDTHRADHLGAARLGVQVHTPVLDALAARGVLFEDCYSATNVTNPSHVSLFTGHSPRDTGIVNNYTPLGEDVPTLAERFREAGWVTFAAVSAAHLRDSTSGLGRGFARMSTPETVRPAAATIRRLEEWLDETEDLPLFAWLHLFDAHGPYDPPEPFRSQYYPSDRDPFDPALPEPELAPDVIPPEFEGLRDLAFPEAMYRGEVSYLDAELGRLLERSRLGEGIIAVTADHGECFGQHGIYFGHEGLFPDTIHVPLVLVWPGAPAGARVPSPVHHVDVGRTLLELAGLADAAFPGRSFAAATEGGELPVEPRFALAAHHLAASITTGGQHLILHLRENWPVYGTSRFEEHQVQLFDLRADPGCTRDLAGAEPELARRLREVLVRWLLDPRPAGRSARPTEDSSVLEQLARLGYTIVDVPVDGAALIDPDCECAWCARFR